MPRLEDSMQIHDGSENSSSSSNSSCNYEPNHINLNRNKNSYSYNYASNNRATKPNFVEENTMAAFPVEPNLSPTTPEHTPTPNGKNKTKSVKTTVKMITGGRIPSLSNGHFSIFYESDWDYDKLYDAVSSELWKEYTVCLEHFHLQAKSTTNKAFLKVKESMVDEDEIGLSDGKAQFKIVLKS